MKKAFLCALLAALAVVPVAPAVEYYNDAYNNGYAVPQNASYNTGYVNNGYAAPQNVSYSTTTYDATYASNGYAVPQNVTYANNGYAAPQNVTYANNGYAAPQNVTYANNGYAPQNVTYANNGGAYYPNNGYAPAYNQQPAPRPRSRAPSCYPERGEYRESPYANMAFASVMFRSVRLKKSHDDDPKAKYTPTSFAVGYAHNFGKLQLGAAFSYEGGNRKLDYSNGDNYKLRTNIPGFSIFGIYRPFDNNTYVSGSGFLGFASYKAKNLHMGGMNYGTGTTERKNLFSLGVEVGHAWRFSDLFVLTPHIGVDYSYAPSEFYAWNGGAFDHLGSQSYWEIPIGVSISKTFLLGGFALTPKVDATLATNVGSVDPKNAHPGFAYRTADSWKVVGASAGSVGARLTAGVDARFTDRVKLGVEYTYEGRSEYNDHRVSATFALSF